MGDGSPGPRVSYVKLRPRRGLLGMTASYCDFLVSEAIARLYILNIVAYVDIRLAL